MGRNKEFDERDVLTKAMLLFWEKGYECTSMKELVAAMGIHRRSIYDTFGDKHNLFLLSLDRYEEGINEKIKENISIDMDVYEKIKIIFTVLINEGQLNRWGCFIINTATELVNIDTIIARKIQLFLNREEQNLYQILSLAKERNELDETTDIDILSSYLHNALIGIRVLSKATNDMNKLNKIMNQNLMVLKDSRNNILDN